MKLEPALPLTVPLALWEAVAEAVRLTFADSYLSGARVVGKSIWPHTLIAYDRLKANRPAMEAIESMGYRLAKPLHFAHPDRPNAADEYKKWKMMMPRSSF